MRLHPSLDGGPFPRTGPQSIGRELAFSVDEYRGRLRRAHAAMDAAALDALVVMNPASVFYLSGFQTFAVDGAACLIVPRQGEPAIVMDPPEFGSAWLSVWFQDLRGYPPESDRPAYAAAMLAEHGLDRGRIGTDDASWGQTRGLSRQTCASPAAGPTRQRR